MHLCIVGGGSAGWMTAAALTKKFCNQNLTITLVESDEIGTVGVGEATLPHIRFFNQTLGIDERDFMLKTKATFKLGIEFVNWGGQNQRYIHPFGDFGEKINMVDFYQHWLAAKNQADVGDLSEYAFGIAAAKQNKFQVPKPGAPDLQNSFGYAYQFDSILYAKYLRDFSCNLGVVREEGKIVDVSLCNKSGNVTQLSLENGKKISADMFVDCSGFRGLLIEQTLGSGYEDWSNWLPCDRAVAVACESAGELGPYTRATAQDAGWIWRIPLQHRTGNGYVYCSEFISDEDAQATLVQQLDGKPIAQPRQLRFKTGRRNHFWKNNVVAIGLSAGFLEPLESTSIHLIQQGITKLIKFFPELNTLDYESSDINNSRFKADEYDVKEYNEQMSLEYARIRDFLLLHYVANDRVANDRVANDRGANDRGANDRVANDRNNTKFWQYFKDMTLPHSLQEKLDAWMHRGYIQRYEIGAFLPPSWVAVMLGQNLIPHNVDPRVKTLSTASIHDKAQAMRQQIEMGVSHAPNHKAFLQQYLSTFNDQVDTGNMQ